METAVSGIADGRFHPQPVNQTLRRTSEADAICRHSIGRFCAIMPMRVAIPAGNNATAATQQVADA